MKYSNQIDFEAQKLLLKVLVGNAKRILEARFGVNAAETTFFEVVDMIGAEEKLKEVFLGMAGQTFTQPDGWGHSEDSAPLELIELVAHEFRWQEIIDLADKRVAQHFKGDRTLAIGDIAMRIRKAFNDDWEDREFYARYEIAAMNQTAKHSH
jgi:hypothetical protein